MAIEYSDAELSVEDLPISDDCYRAIGRVIRAFGEIEDILTLYITTILQLPQTEAYMVTGKAGVTRKRDVAASLTALRQPQHEKEFKQVFNSEAFADLLRCRNALAHGTYIGIADDRFLFIADRMVELDESKHGRVTMSWALSDLQEIADWGEEVIRFCEEKYDPLGSWRRERRTTTLTAHPLAR